MPTMSGNDGISGLYIGDQDKEPMTSMLAVLR
jgi:hypothetical protein